MSIKAYQKLTYLDNGKIGNIIDAVFGFTGNPIVTSFAARYEYSEVPTPPAAICGSRLNTDGISSTTAGELFYTYRSDNVAGTTDYARNYPRELKPNCRYQLQCTKQSDAYYTSLSIYGFDDGAGNTTSGYVSWTLQTEDNWCIFAGRESGEVVSPTHCKLYFITLKLTNGFQASLQPYKRLSDGACGLFDTVNKKFYCATENIEEFTGPGENEYYDENGDPYEAPIDGLNYLAETKELIRQAIINKGVTIANDDTFRSYAEKINNINILDTSDADAQAGDIALDKVAYVKGKRVVGNMDTSGIFELASSVVDSKPYTELNYITSGGRAYIDTGVEATSTIGIELVVKCTDTAVAGAYLGAWDGTGILMGQHNYGEQGNGYYMAGAGAWVYSGVPKDTSKFHTFIYNPIDKIASVDGVKFDIDFNTGLAKSICLFQANTWAEIVGGVSISRCKIYDNNVLIKDYIPVVKHNDYSLSEITLYDLVNNEFALNKGDVKFISGGAKYSGDLTGAVQTIVDEKENKLIPENIKAGVQIFDVVGALSLSSDFVTMDSSVMGGSYQTSYRGIYNPLHKLIQKINTPLTVSGNSVSYLFGDCSSLIEVTAINTTGVANFQGMFSGCSVLVNSPEFDTSSATTVGELFNNCSKLESAPTISTNNYVSASYVFANCTSLVDATKISGLKADNIYGIFMGCTNLKHIPQFALTSSVHFQNAFKDCPNLTDESLNNIMATCYKSSPNASGGTKSLAYIGLSAEQAARCQNLSNWELMVAVGWTTGY